MRLSSIRLRRRADNLELELVTPRESLRHNATAPSSMRKDAAPCSNGSVYRSIPSKSGTPTQLLLFAVSPAGLATATD